LRSRGAPEREAMLKARAFFADLDTPALIHCKSGADRAGFMATLYLLLHENRPLDEALQQLSPRYGHFKWSKTGILDAFFELYRRDGLDKGLTFEDWVANHYDPEALQRDFHAGFWSTLLVDRLLRRE
jgi:protein tyrosine/serine phosphatase